MSVRYFVLGAATLALASSSAIPMWEFLTRGEKMSHLFNMFVKQVAEHCDSSNMPGQFYDLEQTQVTNCFSHDCQKVLLVYGLTNLAKMEDDSLDKMDPYQRGANDIIWESMMHGSYKKKTEEHRDYYADALEPSTSDGNHLGSQEEASNKVESYSGKGYNIVGPMVVRVRPDGSPVPEDRPLPRDEDKEEYQAMRAKPIPSLHHLQHHKHFSSIAEILEASTYKPRLHRLLALHKEEDNYELTTPPGYFHEESLSSIEERFQESQKQKQQERPQPGMVVARHVSTSVSSSRKTKHD